MKKCVIYARVSSETVSKKADSLQSQVNHLMEYAKSNGYRVENVYMDYVSGTQSDRQAFSHLLEEVKQGNVKTILCKDIDRIARSYCDMLDIYKLLQVKSVKIITPKSSKFYGFSHYKENLQSALIYFLERYERDSLSERTKRGIAAKKAREALAKRVIN